MDTKDMVKELKIKSNPFLGRRNFWNLVHTTISCSCWLKALEGCVVLHEVT